MPQFSYDHPALFNGQVAEMMPEGVRSYLNAKLAQITDVVWAGTTAAGTYAIRIQGEEIDETISFTAGGATTPAAVSAGLTADAATNDNLLGVVVVTDDATDTNTLTFVHPGLAYTITPIISGGGNGTGTVTPVQVAGGTRVPIGVVVVQAAADGEGQLPTASSVSADALGITIKSTDSQFNEGDPTLTSAFRPGRMLPVLRHGVVAVYTEDAVVANATVFFRINAPTLSTEAVGRVRSDADGGDAVQLFGARFITSASAGELVKVSINLPANA